MINPHNLAAGCRELIYDELLDNSYLDKIKAVAREKYGDDSILLDCLVTVFRITFSVDNNEPSSRHIFPWERAYVGVPAVSAYIDCAFAKGLLKGTIGDCNTYEVCKKVTWPLADPALSQKLAEKIINAIQYYMVTRAPLPAH